MVGSNPPRDKQFDFNYTLCNLLKDRTATQVASHLGMSKPALSYHLKKLKKIDVIQYIGKGTWEVDFKKLYASRELPERVKKVKKNNLGRSGLGRGVGGKKNFNNYVKVVKEEVAGHAYMFVLKLPVLARWDKRGRRKYLEKKSIAHVPIQQGESLERELTLGWKVWLTNKSLVLWAPKDTRWLAESEAVAYADALYECMRVIKRVESLLSVKLTIGTEYCLKPRREHNAHVKSLLPSILKKRGDMLAVWDEKGVWLRVDESTGEPELESEASGSLQRIGEVRDASVLVREDYNLLKDQQVTRQFLLENDARIQEKMLAYAEHIETHVAVMQEIRDLIKEFRRMKE